MSYFESKMDAVQFVSDMLQSSEKGCPRTMIIGRDRSGAYFAHTAIGIQSEDTAEKPFKLSTITSLQNIPAG